MRITELSAFDNGKGGESFSVNYVTDTPAEFMRCGAEFEHDGDLYRIYGTSAEPKWDGKQHALCELIQEDLSAGEKLLAMMNEVFGDRRAYG